MLCEGTSTCSSSMVRFCSSICRSRLATFNSCSCERAAMRSTCETVAVRQRCAAARPNALPHWAPTGRKR